jgi:hypothetical protein
MRAEAVPHIHHDNYGPALLGEAVRTVSDEG